MSSTLETDELQSAEVAFVFASRLVYSEPEESEIASFVNNHVFESAPFGMQNELVLSGLQKLQSWCTQANESKEMLTSKVASLRREWLALFIGVGTPKAPCWASFYSEPNNLLLGKETLEVRAWYRRFGLQIERLHAEPDDSLGLLLGFVSRLIALEVQARDGADTSDAEKLTTVQADFLAEHVLPWLPAWHYLVSKHASSDFYRGVADLVFGLCQVYADRFGIIYSQDKEAFVFSQLRDPA